MIRSMTGYGSALAERTDERVAVSARSLNHRFLDVSVQLPRRLQPIEAELRGRIGRAVARGRVEVSIQLAASAAGQTGVTASRPLVASLVRTLRDMQNEFGLEGGASVADLVRFPGAIERVEDLAPPPEALQQEVFALLDRALGQLDAMRQAEGARLSAELERVLAAVESHCSRIAARSLESRARRTAALRERLQELLGELGLDEPRLYAEAVRAVERHDVAEELQRLASHLAAIRALLADQGAPQGKRLDFLAQELMREANTLGSKAQDAPAIQEVVGLKAEIERFREQVQNVE